MICFFVSTQGNDSWSGLLPDPANDQKDGPFRTFQQARNAIRALKNKDGGLTEPVTVQIREGLYRIEETFQLRTEDGGTEAAPITWEAYPGEHPVLSGGVRVEAWQPYREGILKAEAPERMLWQGKPRQLFYKGMRQRRSRWPKFDPDHPIAGGWIFPEGPVNEMEYIALHFPAGSFPRKWAKPRQGEVNIYGGWGWCNNIIAIADLNLDQNALRLVHEPIQEDWQPWYFEIRFSEANRFFVENIREEISEPGEWCLDCEEKALYFLPPEPNFDPSQVEVPVLDCLVNLRDTQWITLRGLTFTCTTTGDDYHRQGVQGIGAMVLQQGWAYAGEALHLRGTRYCTVDSCYFDQVGGNAMYLERANYRAKIHRNEIAYAGVNGIVLAGDRPFHPLFCEITDNEIHHAGTILNFVAGIFLGTSDGCLVAHNSLHDLPHHAVNLASNGMGRNYVEYNDIHRVCLAISDTGAINSWMDTPGPWIDVHDERSGHVIRYNLIVDVPGCRVEHGQVVEDWTTRGIYLDDFTSNCLVYGNMIVRSGVGIQIHAGQHNLIENNAFLDCKLGIWGCNFPPLRAGNEHTAGMFRANRFMHNIISTSRKDAFLYWWHKWTENILERCDENLIFAPEAENYRIQWDAHPQNLDKSSVAEWQKMGFDQNSLFVDPQFENPAGEDYRLKETSPALDLGFLPIPFERIGVRKLKLP
jgi:parallel beta-helix repeat protein